ncbi:uncharacterized protein LOC105219249 [Zeugodacus cucurbitae]|uniref:uncharacterized protein LOC105219249 n=1 Tax=Zeugodacus cucurbitae TaxID=28588 RepID=UPI0005967D86|nr:uncharacterized protein LOC105219249 [Zeugodacus cucurbitae]XP_054087940.1 uncharacterized protein LOC105219249 [Zeugodacus cucurbitae]
MNIEQQKFPPPPTNLLSDSGYTNGYATPSSSSITTTSADTSASSPASQTTTYVNIPIIPLGQLPTSASSTSTASPPLPPPPPSTISMMAGGGSTPNSGGTSTFKTPLLPMPTLEDIEGGLLAVTTSNAPTPMPVGILKYPNAAAAAAAASVATTPLTLPSSTLSICGSGMGPGPPPATLMQAPALSLPTSTAASSGYLSGVTSSYQSASLAQQQQQQQLPPATLSLANDMLQHQTTPITVLSLQHSTQQPVLPPPPPSVGLLNNSSGVALGLSTSGNTNMGRSNHQSSAGMGGSVGAASSNNVNSKRSAKCCACFGSSHSSATTKSQHKKHRKQKTQTIWSALLTNLGICALLLAYTLLGSFIFLTIESEDSTFLHHHSHHHHHAVLQRQRQQQQQQQQQRTLASTKRGGNVENIYHTSPEQMHLDNATAYAPQTGDAATASLSGTTAYASAAAANAMLEGIVPLSDENNGDGGVDTGVVDFSYGDELLGGDGITSAQLALSADTQEVRQRTIENIWDITVSLNILYKENWTKLAALEIAKFQDQLIKRLNEDALLQLSHEMDGGGIAAGGGNGAAMAGNSPATEAVLLHTHGGPYGHGHGPHEWNFAKAFLYSLTVLTTIGYGNIAPRTTLGRLVTLVYAIFGIPLTLVYLSSTGGILAKVAREVFSKALCCCLCSNCGYCCYDEKRMAEKERRMKRKRQQEELRKQQAALQEPYYVHDSYAAAEKQSNLGGGTQMLPPDIDSLSASESRGSMHGLSILAPILLCLSMMVIYILIGAVVLYRLEDWPILDGIYFCFMSLSTIGFGDMLPGLRRESTTTTWFCSIYIMSGMALTAMCFNVIHEEIVHRIKIVVEFKKAGNMLDTMGEEQGYYMPP